MNGKKESPDLLELAVLRLGAGKKTKKASKNPCCPEGSSLCSLGGMAGSTPGYLILGVPSAKGGVIWRWTMGQLGLARGNGAHPPQEYWSPRSQLLFVLPVLDVDGYQVS